MRPHGCREHLMVSVHTLKFSRVATSMLFSLAVLASPAAAQDSEQAFFSGKTVRFVVGFGAGGGYDAYARMLAPYLSKALGATVIVENRPGAGGLVALNGVYIAPPDGLTIMIVNGTAAVYSQLTDLQGARYDLGKIGYLATLNAPPSLWTVSPHDKTKTIAQALTGTRKWRWAASGPVDSLSDGAAFTCAGLKLDCHIVLGYKGSNDAALAVARGEMDALYVTDTSANTYVQSNGLVPLATIGQKRSRFFPELPTIFEAAKLDAGQEWIFNFRHLAQSLGRILVTPPAMSESRLAFLEAAVKKALSDPAFLAEGEKRQLYTDYVDGAGTRKNATSIVTTVTPEQRKLVQDILARAR
jgi:tripartite-type tricarboxylate transporter receptor subunit TctC